MIRCRTLDDVFIANCYSLILFLAVTMVSLATPAAAALQERIHPNQSGLETAGLTSRSHFPVLFMANQGQWAPEVLFQAQNGQTALSFTARAAWIQVPGEDSTTAWIRLRPETVAPAMQLRPGEPATSRVSYFHGPDPAAWRTRLPTYRSLQYQGIQDGIDLVFRDAGGRIAYDLVLAPGTSPAQARLVLEGVKDLTLDEQGDMIMTLPNGRALRQQAPVLYQERAGQRLTVAGGFVILASDPAANSHVFGFQVGDYDPTFPLVIDPTLTYSNFVGTTLTDEVRTLAVTDNGEVIVVGSTLSSTSFPGNPKIIGTPLKKDALVYQINDDGTALDFVAILAGSGDEQINAIALGNDGSLFLTGQTNSADFPTANPIFPILSGTTQDAFIAQLNANGDTLLFSTYFGGTKIDTGRSLGFDEDEDLYVAGTTSSTDLLTRHALYPMALGGDDGFVIKLTVTGAGATIQSSTYLGGSGNDSIEALVVTPEGDAYVGGTTASKDLPVKHALQAATAGGSDVWLARIAMEGPELAFCTYLGGAKNDLLTSLLADADGNLFLTGYTESVDFPVHNALYSTLSGSYDAFIGKLDQSGRFLHFATYLGGPGDDRALASALDQADDTAGLRHLYVGGSTLSPLFPTVDPAQIWYAGAQDGFLAKFDPHGLKLSYSSYFGGKASDSIVALGSQPVTGSNAVYLAGNTASTKAGLFPQGQSIPFQNDNAGGIDTFVAYYQDLTVTPTTPALQLDFQTLTPERHGAAVPFTLSLSDPNAVGISAFSTQVHYDINELEYENTKWDAGLPANAVTDIDYSRPGILVLTLYQSSAPTALSDSLATLNFKVRDVGQPTTPPKPSKQVNLTLTDSWAADLRGRNAFIDGTGGAGGVLLIRRCNHLLGDCDCSGQVRIWEVQSGVLRSFDNSTDQPICMKRNYVAMTARDLTEIINNHLDQVTESTALRNLAATNTAQTEARAMVSTLQLEDATRQGGAIQTKVVLRSAGKPISLLSTDVHYNPKVFSKVTAKIGPQARKAGKSLVYRVVKPGLLRILVYGLNKTTLNNGTIGTLRLVPKVSLAQTPTWVRHVPQASNPAAQEVRIQGNRLQLH